MQREKPRAAGRLIRSIEANGTERIMSVFFRHKESKFNRLGKRSTNTLPPVRWKYARGKKHVVQMLIMRCSEARLRARVSRCTREILLILDDVQRSVIHSARQYTWVTLWHKDKKYFPLTRVYRVLGHCSSGEFIVFVFDSGHGAAWTILSFTRTNRLLYVKSNNHSGECVISEKRNCERKPGVKVKNTRTKVRGGGRFREIGIMDGHLDIYYDNCDIAGNLSINVILYITQ